MKYRGHIATVAELANEDPEPSGKAGCLAPFVCTKLMDGAVPVPSPLFSKHRRKGQVQSKAFSGAAHCVVDLNDNGVEGGKENNVTAAVNWYLNGNVRLMFNYIHIDIEKRLSPEKNKQQGGYRTNPLSNLLLSQGNRTRCERLLSLHKALIVLLGDERAKMWVSCKLIFPGQRPSG